MMEGAGDGMNSPYRSVWNQGLTTCTGIDSTGPFNDQGHSDIATDMLPGLYIGDFDESSVSDRPFLNFFKVSPF
jgi:hypothetical protein